jgi:predicted ATPase
MQPELLRMIQRFSPQGDTRFIIAAHSPTILAYPDAGIFSFDGPCIQKVVYQDTDYYHLFRDFLNNRETWLEEI